MTLNFKTLDDEMIKSFDFDHAVNLEKGETIQLIIRNENQDVWKPEPRIQWYKIHRIEKSAMKYYPHTMNVKGVKNCFTVDIFVKEINL